MRLPTFASETGKCPIIGFAPITEWSFDSIGTIARGAVAMGRFFVANPRLDHFELLKVGIVLSGAIIFLQETIVEILKGENEWKPNEKSWSFPTLGRRTWFMRRERRSYGFAIGCAYGFVAIRTLPPTNALTLATIWAELASHLIARIWTIWNLRKKRDHIMTGNDDVVHDEDDETQKERIRIKSSWIIQ